MTTTPSGLQFEDTVVGHRRDARDRTDLRHALHGLAL